MIVLLSILSVVLIVGFLISIALNRSFWPFDNFPMYSYPVHKIRYPIYNDGGLSLFTLLDTTTDQHRDIIAGKTIYSKEFRPLDRLEILLLLMTNGLLSRIDYDEENRHKHHFRWAARDWSTEDSGEELEKALKKVLTFIQKYNPEVKKIAIYFYQWNDIWADDVDPWKPEKSEMILEVGS